MKKLLNIIFALALLIPALSFGQAKGKLILNKPSGYTIPLDTIQGTSSVSLLNLYQTTAGQTIVVPSMTVGAKTPIYIRNIGSVTVTMSPGGDLPIGKTMMYGWTGSAWSTSGVGIPIDTSLLVHVSGDQMTGDLNFSSNKGINSTGTLNVGASSTDLNLGNSSATTTLRGAPFNLYSGSSFLTFSGNYYNLYDSDGNSFFTNASGINFGSSGTIGMSSASHVTVPTPTNSADAVTKTYADTKFSAKLDTSLASGKILIGQSYGGAAAKTPSGDVTISNAGVTAIGASKVTNSMLAGSIDLTSKVTGLLPDGNISSASTWNAKQTGSTNLTHWSAIDTTYTTSTTQGGGRLKQVDWNTFNNKASLSGNTFTGLNQFSGTGHAGLKLNNLTTSQRNALTGSEGMLIANSTTHRINYYDGTAWNDFGTESMKYVTADQTTTAATLQDITDLVFPVTTTTKYKVEGFLHIGCNNTGGVKFGITIPGSATVFVVYHGFTSGSGSYVSSGITASATATSSAFSTVNTANGWVRIAGTITTAGSSGNVQFTFQSTTATQTSTIFSEGSFLSLTPLN